MNARQRRRVRRKADRAHAAFLALFDAPVFWTPAHVAVDIGRPMRGIRPTMIVIDDVMTPIDLWRTRMVARGLNDHEIGGLFDWAHAHAESNPVTLIEALEQGARTWCDSCRGWCAGCHF